MSIKQCSVEGCEKASRRRGWCPAHYYRWSTHGSPEGGGTSYGEPMRFIKAALAAETDECIDWPYASIKGYPSARIDGRGTMLVHRYVCEQKHGAPEAQGIDAAHSCGRGHLGCINPRHLRWATRSENMADMREHGTANRGERNNWARLTRPEVFYIMAMKGQVTEATLAAQFNVSTGAIQGIHTGKSWSWLTEVKQ